MQQARRPPTHISLSIRLPALLLLLPPPSSFLAPPLLPCRLDCSPFLHRIRFHNVKPATASTNVAGETLAVQKIMGLPTRLDCTEQLQYGQHRRSFSLVCGTGTQKNLSSPDLKHKVTEKAPGIEGWSTPAWVKARLKFATQSRLQCYVGYGTRAFQDTAQEERALGGNSEKENNDSSSARKSRQTAQRRGGGIHLQSASTTSEAIALLKNRLQQGISIEPYMYVEVLERCLKQKDLTAAKQVHDCIVKSGMDQNIYLGNFLLRVYITCGRLEDARRVFDGLVKKNIVSWNIMIGGYAQRNDAKDAMEVFYQSREEHVQPNEITYLSILKACGNPTALKCGKEVHLHIKNDGFESDVRVGTALLKMYAKCGSIKEARHVFDNLTERDVISWNGMIGAYAESGFGGEAYRLFLQMKQEDFKPDAITYLSILNACARARALEWVKEVHSHAMEAGFASDLRVGNALVHMYAKSGSVDDARLVFERMEDRNVITWTAMIGAYAEIGCGEEAYQLFLRMKREGFKPNAITFLSILNASASAGALEWVREIHRHVQEAGLDSDMQVGNALVHMYAKCGSIDDARLAFDRIEERDVITWNVIIRAYAESGRGREAYQLFLQMRLEGFTPNEITFVSILNASSAGALEWVKDVHKHVLEAGLDSNLRVGSALVHMYAKSGSIDDARQAFDRLEERDVVTWNVIIGAYADSGCFEEAYRLFRHMRREGFKPDAITYVSILNACPSIGAMEWVKEVQRHVLEAGLDSDLRVGNALVHMCAKSGIIDHARSVFDKMKNRDVVTWNIMIGGLAQHGLVHDALELFRKMNAEGVKPDGLSFLAVLSACSHAGLVDEGRRLFLAMSQDYGIEPTSFHYTCMVDLLGRAGHLEEAKLFIGNMPVEPNGAVWGALLGACRIYGNVELGELAAKELLKLEPEDASTYVLLSNIYAAAGMWEEVSLVRSTMQVRGIRKEPGRSWIEVDNKIHGFVVGDTSHPQAKEIYAVLNSLSERIKAEGYIPDTRLVLENIDEEDKAVALCSHSEKLAIAYGLMRTAPGKPIRIYKNLRVCSDCHTATKFISKVTGREIVARDANRFHRFIDGVCSCGDYW